MGRRAGVKMAEKWRPVAALYQGVLDPEFRRYTWEVPIYTGREFREDKG